MKHTRLKFPENICSLNDNACGCNFRNISRQDQTIATITVVAFVVTISSSKK